MWIWNSVEITGLEKQICESAVDSWQLNEIAQGNTLMDMDECKSNINSDYFSVAITIRMPFLHQCVFLKFNQHIVLFVGQN